MMEEARFRNVKHLPPRLSKRTFFFCFLFSFLLNATWAQRMATAKPAYFRNSRRICPRDYQRVSLAVYPQTQLNQLLFSDNRGICKSSCYTLIDSYSSSLLPSLTTSINWVPVICQTLSRVLGEQRWAKLYGPCYCKLLVQWQCPSTDTIHGSTSVFYSRWKVLWG